MEKIDEIKHYKLYKAGKLWLTMTIATFSLGVMVSSVNADQANTNTSTNNSSAQVVTAANSSAAVPANSAATSNAASSSSAQQSLAPDQPVASQATTSVQSAAKVNSSANKSSDSKTNSSAAKSSASQATKDNTKANSSTKKEADLPALPDLDNNLLSKAGSFHIFANEVQISADVNGNIATQHYISGNEFGTRNESHNYTKGDIYYIETIDQMGANAFRNSENYVVFGEDTNVEIKNGQVFVNGTRMDHLKASAVYKKSGYIDFQKEFANLTSLADYYARQKQTDGVKVNFENNNNNYIDVSGVTAGTKIIYVTVPTGCLTSPQPLTIKGLSSSEDGPVVVMNVNGSVNFNAQTKLEYDDGQIISPNEGHSKPNHVLWNFGANGGTLNINSGYLLGSVLNPQGEVKANVNVDGNLVANRVNISGGESHRWDLRGGSYVETHHQSSEPGTSQSTTPTKPGQSTTPTKPGQSTTPTKPGQSTTPTKPGQSTTPTKPVQPTTPQTSSNQPTQPNEQPTQPSQTQPTSIQSTTPVQSQQPTEPATSETNQPTQPVHQTEQQQPSSPVETQQVKVTPAQSQQAQSQSATGLPQTGNQNGTAATVLGLLTASFGMLFGLKKRHFE